MGTEGEADTCQAHSLTLSSVVNSLFYEIRYPYLWFIKNFFLDVGVQ